MGLSNYPAGVSDSHRHFWEANWPDTCPGCDQEVGDEPICPLCGYHLDPEEAAAIERDEGADYAYDLQRDMERER